MKRLSLTVAAILALAFVSVYALTPQSATVKKVQVTAQTLAGQPAGKPYVIDLSKSGTAYEIDANVNYEQIRVRLATGEKALSSFKKPAGSGKLLLGRGDDLSKLNFGFPSLALAPQAKAVREYFCNGSVCSCNGVGDCHRLNDSGHCTSGQWTCLNGLGPGGGWGCTCFQK